MTRQLIRVTAWMVVILLMVPLLPGQGSSQAAAGPVSSQAAGAPLALGPSAPALQAGASTVPDVPGADAAWWAAAQEEIRQSEYHVTWQDRTYLPDMAAAYQAPNRAHNLRTYFTPQGAVVIPRALPGDPLGPTLPWRWQVRLAAWGREGATEPPGAPTLRPSANRIEYRYGTEPGIVGWYVNDDRGLEQGFTIASAPLPRSAGPLILELALGGDLAPRLASGGEGIELLGPDGVPVLRYDDMRATDSAGRELAVGLLLAGCEPGGTAGACGLRLTVDDAGAVYPIDIDPTIAGLPADWDWKVEGGAEGAWMGYSVSSAGDVNGDGYDDVIVGAPKYESHTGYDGAALVYLGSPCGLSTAADWEAGAETWNPPHDPGFAETVGTAGDVNGDGYDDVLVGAPTYTEPGQGEEGKVYVWYGSATGLGDLGTGDNADWTKEGEGLHARFGTSAGTAGDVNGDGYDEIIVGAPTNGDYYVNAMVFVYRGTASGLDWASYWFSEDADGNSSTYGFLGNSASTAGDVNGDGYDDIVVGAVGHDFNAGAAFVWYGSSGGLGDSGMPDNADWSSTSEETYAYWGQSVGTAGDVNGDGYDDVIVGATHIGSHPEPGAAFIWYGSASGLGDDGTPDNADWSDMGDDEGGQFGSCARTAGDLDRDGYDDIVVGAPNHSGDQADEGRVYVYLGSASGPGSAPYWTVEGNQDNALMGGSAGTAGDVNGDGFADLIVGASHYANGQAGEGAAFAWYGAPTDSPDWSKESDDAGALFGHSAATAGDVNGDGYAELIVGAPSYDGGYPGQGKAFVYQGGHTGLDPVPYWHAGSQETDGRLGSSVATAGDVNGDGYADIIVGAKGAAYVWYGSATGLGDLGTPDNADWSASGGSSTAFGCTLGTAGDVNGDGYSDVIVGAPYATSGEWGAGVAYVWYGSATGLDADRNLDAPDWSASSWQREGLMGISVGTAGDVNGDGYGDVIVGASGYDVGDTADLGGAFVWYGSSSGLGAAGTPDNADWLALGDQALTNMGNLVGTAGDVDGDGYADVIVAAPGYSGADADIGVFVWEGGLGGLGMDGTPANADWSPSGDESGWYRADDAGTAGDVDGDGYADVIVGASLFGYGDAENGRAFVYYGSPSGPSASPDWWTAGTQDNEWLGSAVATAGDVDGDGYADLVVGAPGYDHGQSEEGAAFVWLGSALGPNPTAGAAGLSLQSGAGLGEAVATAGDVNGDGYADVIVGAYKYDAGQTDEGAAFVWHGSEGGLIALAIPANADWAAYGEQASAFFGTAVGTAGDVNGDGYDDVIAGAGQYDGGESNEGRVWVYHGSATGLNAAAAWTAESNQANALLGHAVGTAGDVNGDGYGDVIVGAPFYSRGETMEGLALVWYGSDSGLGAPGTPDNAGWLAESDQASAYLGIAVGMAGDVNRDGYSDVIVGASAYSAGQGGEGAALVWHGSRSGLGPSGTPANAAWMGQSGQPSAGFGAAVGTAGDVDGDGYADVIIGAPDYDGDWTDEGRVWVYNGSATGVIWLWGWTEYGAQNTANLGVSVGTAGDVNGDGYADVIVGAGWYNRCSDDEGVAYIYYGSDIGLEWAPAWTATVPQADAHFGHSAATAGDVNGDGYADVIVGAYGFDSGQGGAVDDGAFAVYYGNGSWRLSSHPRQRRADGSGPIAHLGAVDDYAFRLGLWGRSPFGRGKVRLEWEVKRLGTSFSGTGIQHGTWQDSGSLGVELDELVSGLAGNTAYHWRVRLRFQAVTTPFQQAGPWRTMPWHGWNEADLRTVGNSRVLLPLIVRDN